MKSLSNGILARNLISEDCRKPDSRLFSDDNQLSSYCPDSAAVTPQLRAVSPGVVVEVVRVATVQAR